MSGIDRPTSSIAGWVECPDCGAGIPIGLAPMQLVTNDEGEQVATVDLQMDDVWAHAWTHSTDTEPT